MPFTWRQNISLPTVNCFCLKDLRLSGRDSAIKMIMPGNFLLKYYELILFSNTAAESNELALLPEAYVEVKQMH
jgi:hypothetical protein